MKIDSTTLSFSSASNSKLIKIEDNSTSPTTSATLTLLGNAQLASGNYGAVSSTGSEQITVAGSSFNVVTRNTRQEITGDKSFIGNEYIFKSSSFNLRNI